MASLLPPPIPPILVVCLKPSARLAVMLSFAHFSAIGLLWPLVLPVSVKLAGSAMLAASLIFYLRRYVLLRSPDSVTGFELSDEMACMLETRRGERIACALLASSFVAPYLTVLELKPMKPADARFSELPRRSVFSRSVVILPDAIDPEEFRQLRVLLRWKWKDPKDAPADHRG
ncbi:protein YgfX [Nitrosovibrio sp. Nv6]|uniref:protein YgfX n=1 Tax=Nitrosovibrio sp. Nv6 TaxID=1855340 RepID=UPI0008B05CC5|nr:protein YgfX [Nitrosovibrio sp. Nv6]SEO67747.1 toxin CptA [Nitrosovibrio sp. Nv6]